MFFHEFRKVALASLLLPIVLALGCNQQPSLTPIGTYPTYVLAVNTVDPASGVAINVSYADLSGSANGTE